MGAIFLQVGGAGIFERKVPGSMMTGLKDLLELCHILQQCCIIIPVSQLGCKLICNCARSGCIRFRRGKSIDKNIPSSMFFRLFQQTSVLALPWWQRVLLVAPVCLLLWLGVIWALGVD
ncbi:hypothetical protein [Herbaspirillum sp. RV1423]|uniref:hypothetical protein n=1 Tax=Herbaspirillum sp. RV1423 TaxID=1443993 RepID=UPI0005544010|nr:hypothetical protein [Herbaspirillum sp. RV1423]